MPQQWPNQFPSVKAEQTGWLSSPFSNLLKTIGRAKPWARLLLLFSVTQASGADCPGSPASAADDCLVFELRRLEETLQIVYEELLESIPINDPDVPHIAREKLEKAHQAWLAFRKAPCGYRGFLEGGVPGYKTVYEDECLIAATQSRLDELKSIRKSYQ